MSTRDVPTLGSPTIDTIQRLCGLAAIVGLWATISPFLWAGEVSGGFLWSSVVIGAVITLLAAYASYMAYSENQVRRYAAYLAGFGGLYVVLSPYFFGETAPNLLLNTFFTGLVIAILTGYSAYVAPAVTPPEAGRQTA